MVNNNNNQNICDWLLEENEQLKREAKNKFNGEVTLLNLAQPCIGIDSQVSNIKIDIVLIYIYIIIYNII